MLSFEVSSVRLAVSGASRAAIARPRKKSKQQKIRPVRQLFWLEATPAPSRLYSLISVHIPGSAYKNVRCFAVPVRCSGRPARLLFPTVQNGRSALVRQVIPEEVKSQAEEARDEHLWSEQDAGNGFRETPIVPHSKSRVPSAHPLSRGGMNDGNRCPKTAAYH